ncbi:VPLPA-CTERM sorting domain-containing protein [Roseobacter sp. YSTF-M11]|uniref:VPLPA-CTERM sorting domain-containing protein n=1 Tax=Roseobacter insulae TaxID=2859783 RepID=A0A9X1K140_9RHOB|nr:VPLPA-CTERM sorting domain-containing protein [Roseobacter insulae]MBW4707113.1 VPLPA-CTERM sorting domain-containing protein [Roseobacter insulae]
MKRLTTCAAILAGMTTFATVASAATYDIDWTGSGGYALTGSLSFSDALLGTGVITASDIDNLTITVLRDGVSLGARNYLTDGAGSHAGTFNLNFDTSTGQFVTGGFSGGVEGQTWFTSTGGLRCDTVGFASGSVSQGVCVDNALLGRIGVDDSTLTATAALAVVPLPAGAVLLMSALGALGLARRRRRHA